MMNFIKRKYENLYIILVSLMIGIWFNGIASLINYFFPNKNLIIIIILCTVPIIFFYLDDFSLSELHKIDNKNVSAVLNASLQDRAIL